MQANTGSSSFLSLSITFNFKQTTFLNNYDAYRDEYKCSSTSHVCAMSKNN